MSEESTKAVIRGALPPGDEAPDAGGEKPLDEYECAKRDFTGTKWETVLTALAVAGALYHLYALGMKASSALCLRNIHLSFGLMIIALLYPASKRSVRKVAPLDVLMIAGTVAVGVYVLLQDPQSFAMRSGSKWTTGDLLFGVLAILLVLEATRRVIGPPLVIVAAVFFAYALFGEYFPGIFINKSFRWEKVVSYIFSMDGLYGTPIGTSSTYVILFIIFGCFLKNSGAGEFYTNFSYAVAGRARGGPAKVAIVSSALFGTISGSGIANVVTTGAITIPLMKKAGFKSTYAAAVEAVSSTGGQIMPPIMGAGAFLMAEMIGVPYSTVMVVAALPALLYFVAVYFVVDIQAAKRGLKGLAADQLPSLGQVLKAQGHLVVPLGVLIYTLMRNYTPIKAAFLSMLSTVAVSWLRKGTRMGPDKIIGALRDGALGCMEVIAACGCAGIIMALVNLTSLGLKLTTMIKMAAGSNLLAALILTAAVVVVLSMGLPTTACYLISSTIMAPALISLGISPIQAHMFIFYYACLSGITPPVALTAYPAGAIAKANPVTVSFLAFRIGLVGFLVPFMFIYSPNLLWRGALDDIAVATATALLGAFLISTATERYFRGALGYPAAGMIFAAGLLTMTPGWKTDLMGAALVAAAAAVTAVSRRRQRAA